ncbi:HAD family hydrolase [Aquimarina algicola]|uniref:phosphoglycolate phosphatase n=1 Tax=Aquimarina algicola TaxID=2589995 RepID=A0A504J4S2_9FLAO|nr:HAD hydrolase-like protein [Aquimarina algicola]TPN82898.1 HAD family hydrolase [Aquimarina algicola]
MEIDAILWDYDGTLVNSVPKNIDITKQILAEVAPRLTGKNLPEYLKSERSYHIANHDSKNWQDLYVNYYGMTTSEMLDAGALWTEYQLQNTTPVELFEGIKETMNHVTLPQGICSQNSSQNILRVLKKNGLGHKFQAIVGYDDIPNNVQKPNSFGGIKCLEQLFEDIYKKTIIYVGDHEGDVEFARNLNSELGKKNNVIAVIANYSGANTQNWNFKPDFEIKKPTELINILNNYS